MLSAKNLHILEQIRQQLALRSGHEAGQPALSPMASAARHLLAPFINGVNQRQQQPLPNTKKSAVLLLLWEREKELHITFTLRARHLAAHGGQISFPGGMCEKNETPVQTALRETHEEIGIQPHTIKIIGELSPLFVLPSNSNIHPVVGYSEQFLDMKINHMEVEEAFSKPIDYFSFNNILQKEWIVSGEMLDIPYWSIHPSVPLWGASAMILAEFVELYRSIGKVQ